MCKEACSNTHTHATTEEDEASADIRKTRSTVHLKRKVADQVEQRAKETKTLLLSLASGGDVATDETNMETSADTGGPKEKKKKKEKPSKRDKTKTKSRSKKELDPEPETVDQHPTYLTLDNHAAAIDSSDHEMALAVLRGTQYEPETSSTAGTVTKPSQSTNPESPPPQPSPDVPTSYNPEGFTLLSTNQEEPSTAPSTNQEGPSTDKEGPSTAPPTGQQGPSTVLSTHQQGPSTVLATHQQGPCIVPANNLMVQGDTAPSVIAPSYHNLVSRRQHDATVLMQQNLQLAYDKVLKPADVYPVMMSVGGK